MATYPYERAKPLGWAYGEILTSAQMNTVDDNAASAADGSLWTDVAIVKNWAYTKDFSSFFSGTTGATVALWDSLLLNWHLFTYDASDNPIGEYAQDGFGGATASLSWTSHTIPAGATLRPLCAATDGAGVLIIGGAPTGSSTSKIRETSDGTTWAARTTTATGTIGARAAVWHEGASKFIVGLDNAAATNIETSPTGQTWTQITGLPNSHARGSIASDGTTLVATAYDTSTNKCITSTSGATWTEATLPTTEKWIGVVYDSVYEQFIAIGETTVAYSDDSGATWATAGAHGASPPTTLSRVAILGRVFCFIDSDDLYAGHVVDGTLTVRKVLQVVGSSIRAIAAGENQLCATDSSENAYWTIWGGGF